MKHPEIKEWTEATVSKMKNKMGIDDEPGFFIKNLPWIGFTIGVIIGVIITS